MEIRPPVVVVMGHIDHGKTTLLDYIRKTNVAQKEKGGITQSIGAYEVEHNGKKITFIDTPGHEAFSKMRAHGASVADLAILVVAADDGVKPQTKEALEHIKKAGISFIVAINKIDLPSANPEKTKQDLLKAGVYLEGYGGNVSYQLISAKTGKGVDELLDLINLAAEIEGFSYNPQAPAEGVVLTSVRDSRRGIVVGAIVKEGILYRGDEVFTTIATGRVRLLEDFLGRSINEAKPSSPVMILGFDQLPGVGEMFKVGSKPEIQEKKSASSVPVFTESEEKKIKVVLKAKEVGSLEVLKDLFKKLNSRHSFFVVDASVGDVYENDVKLAFSAKAILVGFGVKVDKVAESIAKTQKVKIISASVIYDLEQELEKYAHRIVKKKNRYLEILATFGEKEGKQIIGGRIEKGFVKNQEEFEIFKGDQKIGSGKIINLQSQRKDVSEAKEGEEVGLLVESSVKISAGYRLVFE